MAIEIPLESLPACCLPMRPPSEAAQPGAPAPSPTASTLGMVLLPGGSFLMGSDGPEAWPGDGEGPVREVAVVPFWMDAGAVTNTQFAAFVEATGYVTEAEKFGWSFVFHKHVSNANKKAAQGVAGDTAWWLGITGAHWRKPEGPGSDLKKRGEHPVVHVSWHDANAYCAWAGKALPTEVQWEYAARGGLAQKLYPWGDELTTMGKGGKVIHHCNIWQGKFPTLDTGADGWTNTAPVKTFAPNAFGLYQMSGNVWEWCADWFSTTPDRSRFDETRRVVKGGSFLCHASYCNRYRVAARTGNTPDSTTSHTGFRCVSCI